MEKMMYELKQEDDNDGFESKFLFQDVRLKLEVDEEEEVEEGCLQPVKEVKCEPEVLDDMIKNENFGNDCNMIGLKEDWNLSSRITESSSPPPICDANLELVRSDEGHVTNDTALNDSSSSITPNYMDKFPFTCEVCGKSLNCNSDLKAHLLIHSSERRFSCEVCGKSFDHKSMLENHMLIHTGDRPFSCAICGKSFNRKSHVKVHMLVHTADLQYPCEVCGKCFKYKCNLKRHIVIHTGEHPFSCDVCGKSFIHRSTFTRHIASHSK